MPDDIFLTRRHQAKRYNVSARTIDRWSDDPNLALPAEIDIAGRRYRKLSDLEIWERARAAVAAANRAILRKQRMGQPAVPIDLIPPGRDTVGGRADCTEQIGGNSPSPA